MKKIKYGLWAIFIALLGLMVYQNKMFFLTKSSLGLDLGFYQNYTPELYNLVIIIAFFLCGMLISYGGTLLERYRAKKNIKTLQRTIDASSETIAELRKEVDALKVGWEPEQEEEAAPDAAVRSRESEASQTSQAS
jgi:preprotein translocase subunit SecF